MYRKRGTVTVSNEVAVSGDWETVWDKLESGGAEYSDSGGYHVAKESDVIRGTGVQAAGGTAPDGAAAGHPVGSGKKIRTASRRLTARIVRV